MQLLEGYLRKRVRGNVLEYYCPQEMLWIATEKHIVGNFVVFSAAYRGISSMDGTILSIMERCDTLGKSECPYKVYLAGTTRMRKERQQVVS
jgi:hypothetical protein